MSPSQVFLNEISASFVLLFLAYGVGLDPRQALIFGPKLGPVLVGSSLGLVSFATSGIAPGYAGAQMNPARCFAYGIAKRDMSSEYRSFINPSLRTDGVQLANTKGQVSGYGGLGQRLRRFSWRSYITSYRHILEIGPGMISRTERY